MSNSISESIIELHLFQDDYNKCVCCSKTTSKLVSYKLLKEDLYNNDSIKAELKKDGYNKGVYILIGTNDEGEDIAYIGKAQDLLTRIKQPHTTIPEWVVVILITTNDNSLNGTMISYLESKFIEEAETVNRYILKNDNRPNDNSPTRREMPTLNEYIPLAKLYIQTLGCKIFIPLVKDTDEKFYLKHAKGIYDATGIYDSSSNHFVVLKGSKMQDRQPTAGTAKYVIDDRERYKDKYNNFVTTADIEFNSPSVAASFVVGQNFNGLLGWKTKEGKTLKEYKNAGIKSE